MSDVKMITRTRNIIHLHISEAAYSKLGSIQIFFIIHNTYCSKTKFMQNILLNFSDFAKHIFTQHQFYITIDGYIKLLNVISQVTLALKYNMKTTVLGIITLVITEEDIILLFRKNVIYSNFIGMHNAYICLKGLRYYPRGIGQGRKTLFYQILHS